MLIHKFFVPNGERLLVCQRYTTNHTTFYTLRITNYYLHRPLPGCKKKIEKKEEVVKIIDFCILL